MAEAPPCRLCGYKHWPRDPHVFKGQPVKQQVSQPAVVKAPVSQHVKVDVSQPCKGCAERDQTIEELRSLIKAMEALGSKPAFDKKSYHREYMRRKRAKKE